METFQAKLTGPPALCADSEPQARHCTSFLLPCGWSKNAVTSLEQIIPELRDAIGPVILISGVGLLLLTMTNRLGRAIDRARLLKADLPKRTDAERAHVQEQVAIIYRRAKMIRFSITLAALSALLAAALVVTLFLAALLQWQNGWLVSLVFIACMVSLIASLVAFIRDINLSLHALKLELESNPEPKGGGAI
jgi:hypothetical protein